MKTSGCIHDGWLLMSNFNEQLNKDYLYYILSSEVTQQQFAIAAKGGTSVDNLNIDKVSNVQIPIPPKEIQQKIVAEIEVLEKKEKKMREKIEEEKKEIADMFNNYTKNKSEMLKLSDICEMKAGQFVKTGDIHDKRQEGLYPCYGGNGLRGYTKTYTHDGLYPLVGRQGALCGNVHLVKGKFHATEHALVVTHKKNIDRIWLYHKLISMNLNQYAKGTAQPGLSVENLTPIQISIPPLLEQQKIVSKIEKIETQIFEAQKIIDEIHVQKNNVLKKYEIC
jgi:restriction endonuclease S subunit